MSEVPQHWRLERIRYGLVGNICPHCETLMFPPREICIDCGQSVKRITGEIYPNLKVSSLTALDPGGKLPRLPNDQIIHEVIERKDQEDDYEW